jgi:hypothetical protein
MSRLQQGGDNRGPAFTALEKKLLLALGLIITLTICAMILEF